MKEWKCKSCGCINKVKEEDLESNTDYFCEECGSFHILELLCSGEIAIEEF